MILISIGNTRTLLARTTDGEHFVITYRSSKESPAQIRHSLPATWADWWKEEEIFLAGVVPEVLQHWQEELQNHYLPDWDPGLFHQLLPNAYQPPEALGFDRRCCLLGAWQQLEPGGAALVIDTGTAITIDTLAGEQFLGGQILPGLQSQLDCLQRQTALLPKVTLTVPEKFLGNDTTTSMLAGVWYGTLSAIRQAIEEFQRLYRHGRVFLTGGDAETLLPHLARVTYDPQLLLRGFSRLVKKNNKYSK